MGGDAHRGIRSAKGARLRVSPHLTHRDTTRHEPHGDLPSDQLESLPGGQLTLKATEETTGKLSVPSLIAQSHKVQFTECKAELKLP